MQQHLFPTDRSLPVWVIRSRSGKYHQMRSPGSGATICGRKTGGTGFPGNPAQGESGLITCKLCKNASPHWWLQNVPIPRGLTPETLMVCRDMAMEMPGAPSELPAILFFLAHQLNQIVPPDLKDGAADSPWAMLEHREYFEVTHRGRQMLGDAEKALEAEKARNEVAE